MKMILNFNKNDRSMNKEITYYLHAKTNAKINDELTRPSWFHNN